MSFLGMLYIISKLKKSRVQCFKRCANQNCHEEVMHVRNKLVVGEFKIHGEF